MNILGFSWIFCRTYYDFLPFVNLFWHKFVLHKFILPYLSLVMKTNSFTWFDVAYTNIKSKTKINGPLPDPSSLMRISSEVSTLILFYITVVEVLAIFRGCIDKGARGHALPHCFAKQKKKCSSWKINKKHEIVKRGHHSTYSHHIHTSF